MFSRLLLPVLLLAAAPAPAQNADHDPVVMFRGDDVEMQAAKAEARRTLPAFFTAVANPAADESDFVIKFDIDPDGDHEWIWAAAIQLEGDQIAGTLANAPIKQGFAIGDRVPIERTLIGDWGYLKNGVMQGHRTTRVLLKKLSAKDAAAIRAQFGW